MWMQIVIVWCLLIHSIVFNSFEPSAALYGCPQTAFVRKMALNAGRRRAPVKSSIESR